MGSVSPSSDLLNLRVILETPNLKLVSLVGVILGSGVCSWCQKSRWTWKQLSLHLIGLSCTTDSLLSQSLASECLELIIFSPGLLQSLPGTHGLSFFKLLLGTKMRAVLAVGKAANSDYHKLLPFFSDQEKQIQHHRETFYPCSLDLSLLLMDQEIGNFSFQRVTLINLSNVLTHLGSSRRGKKQLDLTFSHDWYLCKIRTKISM